VDSPTREGSQRESERDKFRTLNFNINEELLLITSGNINSTEYDQINCNVKK
jgi:hypothetical protein